MTRDLRMLEWAVNYLARGWKVLPLHTPASDGSCSCGESTCVSVGKHPRVPHGLLEATDETGKIQEWWARWPNANIGVRTGEVSRIVVLDVDVGVGKSGDLSLENLEKNHGPLPITAEAITGGGGRHLFFTHPGTPVKSVNGALGENLDIKGDGGYIVAAPSRHVSGAFYAWKESCAPGEIPLAPMPPWLISGLTELPGGVHRQALNPEQILAGVPEGKRDETLTRYACRLRAQGLAKIEGEALLKVAAENAIPPFPVNVALAKVESAWAKYSPRTRSSRGPSQVDKAVRIALNHELFRDQRNDTYAVVEEGKVRRIFPIRSREFRRHLRLSFFQENGSAVGTEAVITALETADAKAAHDGAMHPLEVRFAVSGDGGIWIDLADELWRAIEVTKAGSELNERPPFLFRRFKHQQPLPPPASGVNPQALLDLLNLKNEENEILALSWLVAVPVVSIPRPGLMLHGVKGSGKSVTAKMLRECLDPSALDGLDLARDARELAQFLDHTAVPWFDNLSKLKDWQSDRLCAAITGGGFSKRELYTDADDVLMSFRRAMVITGINLPTAAPDLLDRMILIELEPPSARLEEAYLWRRFRELHAGILGGIVDTLSAAMREFSGVKLVRPPRMADFAHWAAAAAEALGYGADTFEKVYQASFERQVEEVISSDPVAAAIKEFAAAEGTWRGTQSELLARLNERNEAAHKPKDSEWPKRAAELGKRFRVLTPTLQEMGLTIEVNSSHKNGREIVITDPASLPKFGGRDE